MKQYALIGFLCLLPYAVIWYGMNYIQNSAITLVLYHGLCLIPAIVACRKTLRKNLVLPSKLQIILLLLSSCAFSFISLASYKLLGDMVMSSEHTFELMTKLGHTMQFFWPLSIYFVTVNSLLEELFWRGIIMTKVDDLFPNLKYSGILVSSVAYGAFHYPILELVMFPGWAVFGAFLLAIYGALLAVLYKKTDSLVVPWIAHALLTDLSAILLMLKLFERLHVQ